MTNSLNFILDMLNSLFNLMNRLSFDMGGFRVYYGWLLVSMVIIYIATAHFWKGGRG